MVKAFCYLRVSGLGQVRGDGFRRQFSAIKTYMRAHDLQLARFPYRERGVSGTSDHDDRPAMRKMLADLAADGVRTVVIEKLDRLARDLIIQEGIVSKLRKLDAVIISTAEPDLCSDDPSRKFIRRVLGAVAELDRDLTVNKLRAARDRKRKLGRCEGRIPFGHDPKRPHEVETLRFILYLAQSEKSALNIARKLNAQGFHARNGGKFYQSTVDKILRRARNERAA